jgi:hypothetical protein
VLRRAIRLSVEEQRRERERRRQMAAEIQEQMRELREAQKVTETKLQAFIDSMRQGGNGRE